MQQILRPCALLTLPLFASLQIAAGASTPVWSQSGSGFLAQGAFGPASQQQSPGTQQSSLGGCPIVHEQPVDLLASLFSDTDSSQAIADDITLAVDTEVCNLTILGIFTGNQMTPGDFTILVHEDAGGEPGPVVYSESGVDHQFSATGKSLPQGQNVFEVDMFPDESFLLNGGVRYWFEIYFDSGIGTPDWAWASASPDPESGQAQSQGSSTVPGVDWISVGLDLAIRVYGQEPAASPECYVLDDGLSNLTAGIPGPGPTETLWLQGFQAISGSDVINVVSTTFGSPSGSGLTPGQAGNVCVYDDPTNDFDPTDAVLLYSAPISSANEHTNLLVSFPIPSIPVTGVFFVGVSLEHGGFQPPAAIDTSITSNGRAWLAGGPLGSLDLVDLSANAIPPSELDAAGLLGVLRLRATGENCVDGSVGTPLCSPANANSFGTSGTLIAEGSDIAADNNLTLVALGLPPFEIGYLVNSMNTQMLPISDGLLCIGPGLGRHVAQATSSDMTGRISTTVDLTNLPRSSGPEPALAGQTWYFQLWHRDGSASNFTNALEILFQ